MSQLFELAFEAINFQRELFVFHLSCFSLFMESGNSLESLEPCSKILISKQIGLAINETIDEINQISRRSR